MSPTAFGQPGVHQDPGEPGLSARTKHIGIKVHLVRNYFEKGGIVVPYISTHEQLADIFTEPLPKATFGKFASRPVH